MNKFKRITSSLLAMAVMLGTCTGLFAITAQAADTSIPGNVELAEIKYTFHQVAESTTRTATNKKGATYNVTYNGFQSDADGYLDKGNRAAYVKFKDPESGKPQNFEYSDFDATITLKDKNVKLADDKAAENLKGYLNAVKINDDLSDFSVQNKGNPTEITFSRSSDGYALIHLSFEGFQYADQSDTAQLTFGTLKYENNNSPATTQNYSDIKIQMIGAQKAKYSDAGVGDDDNDDEDDNGNTGVSVRTSTPYIVINEYSIGSESITAGDTFDLTFSIYNTHRRLTVENILMTITTGDGLQLTNSSNTFYLSRLQSDSPVEKTIQFSVLPNAEVKSHPINIEFSYEYVANDERSTGQTRESITVPVIQKDRFSAFVSEVSEQIYPGEEGDLSASYVNKGRSEIFNLTASIICEGISNQGQEQNLGNIAAGASGDVDFYLKPIVEGDFSGEILFTYEDANANVKEYRVQFNTSALPQEEQAFNPGMMDPGMMDPEMTDPGMEGTEEPGGLLGLPNWVWGCAAGGVVIVIIAVVVVVTKKKKAAKEFDDEDI